jgi:hypothetical protein
MTDENKIPAKAPLNGGAFRPHALGVPCPNEEKKGLGPQAVAIPAFPPYLSSHKPK